VRNVLLRLLKWLVYIISIIGTPPRYVVAARRFAHEWTSLPNREEEQRASLAVFHVYQQGPASTQVLVPQYYSKRYQSCATSARPNASAAKAVLLLEIRVGCAWIECPWA